MNQDIFSTRADSYIKSLIDGTKSFYGSFESMSKLVITLLAYQEIGLIDEEKVSSIIDTAIQYIYEDDKGGFSQSAKTLLSSISQSKPVVFKHTIQALNLLENYLRAVSYRVYKLNDSKWILYDKKGYCWLIMDFYRLEQDNEYVYYSVNGLFREDLQFE